MVAFTMDVPPVFNDCHANTWVSLEDPHLAPFGCAVKPEIACLGFPSEVDREEVRLVLQTAGNRHDPYRREDLLNLSRIVQRFVGATKMISLHVEGILFVFNLR